MLRIAFFVFALLFNVDFVYSADLSLANDSNTLALQDFRKLTCRDYLHYVETKSELLLPIGVWLHGLLNGIVIANNGVDDIQSVPGPLNANFITGSTIRIVDRCNAAPDKLVLHVYLVQ